jgi:hypothetical protein
MDAQRALSEDYTSHCSIAQIAASYSHDAAVRDQALAASVQALAFRSKLESFKSEYFLDTVKQHAAVGPSTGICDTILVMPVHFGGQNPGILKARDYLKEFSLVRLPQYKPPKRTDKQNQLVAPSGPSPHLSPATASSSTRAVNHTVLLMVSIQPRTVTVPYFNCTHLFESPRRYGTVATTAVYGSRQLVRDNSTMPDFGYPCLRIIYCSYIL